MDNAPLDKAALLLLRLASKLADMASIIAAVGSGTILSDETSNSMATSRISSAAFRLIVPFAERSEERSEGSPESKSRDDEGKSAMI